VHLRSAQPARTLPNTSPVARIKNTRDARTNANTSSYSLKVGRVVIITRGRYAGKKCVIISPLDNGTKSHPFPHALVAGIERYPSKVTRGMSKKKQDKKSKVKPFVKQVNCTWTENE
jgi:ribosomal protein L14E/L6E/L27E